MTSTVDKATVRETLSGETWHSIEDLCTATGEKHHTVRQVLAEIDAVEDRQHPEDSRKKQYRVPPMVTLQDLIDDNIRGRYKCVPCDISFDNSRDARSHEHNHHLPYKAERWREQLELPDSWDTP